MRSKSSIIYFLYICVVLSGVFFAAGLSAAGTTTGSFLLVNIQARETSLGGIFSPYYAKPGAATINPACLQGIVNKYIMFTHHASAFLSHYEQVEYAQPLDVSSAASAYFMYSSNDELFRTDSTGQPVERIDNYDAIIGVSYSRALNEEYNVGASLKLISEKLYDSAHWGAAINLGVLYRNYDNRYTIGADIENLGLSTAFFKDKSMYPVVFRAGFGMDVYRYEEEYKISLFIEERIYLIEDDGTETSFGMEAAYKKFFTFRYGYIFGKTEGRVAVGAGVRVADLFLDYAYQPYFVSDNAHRVTIKYVF